MRDLQTSGAVRRDRALERAARADERAALAMEKAVGHDGPTQLYYEQEAGMHQQAARLQRRAAALQGHHDEEQRGEAPPGEPVPDAEP